MDDTGLQKAGKAFWSGTSRLIKTGRKTNVKYAVTGKGLKKRVKKKKLRSKYITVRIKR